MSRALDELELRLLRLVAKEVERIFIESGGEFSARFETLSSHMNAWSVIKAQQQGEQGRDVEAGMKVMEKRTLELSYMDVGHLVSVLLHEREVLQLPIDGQPRKTGGVPGQIPVIDGLIRKLHEVYPEQNWIRLL